MHTSALALQLAISALISAAAAGILIVILFLLVTLTGSAPDLFYFAWSAIVMFFAGILIGSAMVLPSVILAGLPAFVVGSLLWSAGQDRAWARGPAPFAASGVIMGALAYGLLFGTAVMDVDELDFFGGVSSVMMFVIFLAAGAGAGLIFRTSMFRLGRIYTEGREGGVSA